MRLTSKFVFISIICSFIISYLWKFQDFELIIKPQAFILNPFFIIPGLLPFFLTKNTFKIFPNVFIKLGSVKYYLISFTYNLILFSGILIIGFILKILRFNNLNNFETQLLGLILDIPLFLIIWLPSIYLYEFAWRGFILENQLGKPKFKKILELAFIASISFIVLSIFFILHSNIIFAISFLISQFLNAIVLNLFYIKSRSIWLCSFHHILFIVFNTYIFGSIFEDGILFNEKYGILNANGGIGVFLQILLLILLYIIIKNDIKH